MKTMKFKQGVGFSAYSPKRKPLEGQDTRIWFNDIGFTGRVDGEDGTRYAKDAGLAESCVLEHYVHKNGLGHLTVIVGAFDDTCVFTDTPIDFMALRVALAPIALVQSLDALMAGLNEAHLFGKGQRS